MFPAPFHGAGIFLFARKVISFRKENQAEKPCASSYSVYKSVVKSSRCPARWRGDAYNQQGGKVVYEEALG